jgi:hypothetical protein
LALGHGSALHLLDLDGRCFVLGVNRTGLQSLMPLAAPFQETLEALQQQTLPPAPPAAPSVPGPARAA